MNDDSLGLTFTRQHFYLLKRKRDKVAIIIKKVDQENGHTITKLSVNEFFYVETIWPMAIPTIIFRASPWLLKEEMLLVSLGQ